MEAMVINLYQLVCATKMRAGGGGKQNCSTNGGEVSTSGGKGLQNLTFEIVYLLSEINLIILISFISGRRRPYNPKYRPNHLFPFSTANWDFIRHYFEHIPQH